MHDSEPTEQHLRLERLAGTWVAEETMYPSRWVPEASTAEGRSVNRLGVGGMFLLRDYVQTRDGQVTYEGHGVVGYDTRRGKYTVHWFDSMGGAPAKPATGTWDGDRLVFEEQADFGHVRHVYAFSGDDAYAYTLENSSDGGATFTPFMTGTYRRE